ncbi:MAG TPA: hypothetical protein VF950_12490 [Planctomycetota bacterium]
MHLILTALLAFGSDIGPKPLSYGGQPTPLKDMPGIEVEMAAEDVKLVLHRSRLDVEVVFHMLNHGPDAEFEEGFPVGPYRTMKGFAFTIDGKPLPFKLVDRKSADPKADRSAEPEKDLFKGDAKEPDYWYVWTAAFKAGARHTHVVKYSVDLSHQHFYHQTGYILHTGAAWKNPIGKATVTLTFGEGTSVDHLRGVRPFDNARVQSNQVAWTFENFEPTKAHDIVIGYDLDTWKEDVAKLRADASWNGRRALAATLKELPGWQGRKTFTTQELRDYLDALGGLVSEGAMEDGKFVFPGTDPEQVSGPPELTKLFAGQTRMRYYVLEDDILHMFQGFLDEALAAARAHPAEAKATLTLYRDFLRRLANGEVHVDFRKLSGGRNAGKVLPARALKPEEKKTLEAKLAEADALLK